MKKYVLATLFLGIFVFFLEPAENLISGLLRIEQPTIHEVRENDWLSKIALKYYGDSNYWKELKLINRAPEGNLIFPGESIIIPSFSAVQKIKRAKKLSDVNKFVREQQNILANYTHSANPLLEDDEIKPTEPLLVVEAIEAKKTKKLNEIEKVSDGQQGTEVKEHKSSSAIALIAGLTVIAIAFVIGIYKFIRRQKKDEVTYYGASADAQDENGEKSIYFDDFDKKEIKKDKESTKKNLELV